MKRKRELRKAKIVKISMGNLRDLIVPFLYQTKVLKSADVVDSIFINSGYFEDFRETKDIKFLYSLELYLREGGRDIADVEPTFGKKGGVEDSKET